MEADRMVNLALTKKQVETEREVVVEERLSSVEDSVEGLLDEMMHLQTFKTHPYRFPIIGLMKDIKAVTTEKALAFYRTYYAPTTRWWWWRASWTRPPPSTPSPRPTAGWARRSCLPRRPSPEKARRRRCGARWSGRCPPIASCWGSPRPALAHADRAAYELLAEILAGGPSSRLYSGW
jgi:zinc protease